MELPEIPLFDWLLENLSKTKIDLANSSITGVKLDELLAATSFEIPKELNMGKNDPYGASELLDALVGIYNCPKSNIIPTTGGSEANFLLFLTMLKAGDEVIVEQPGYSPLWLVPQMLGAKVIKWPRRFENNFALDLEMLKNNITNRTKLIVITNLHNPSGVLATNESIRAAAEIAADHGAWLVIDEMFLDVASTTQASAVGMNSVIVTASVSKVYGIGGLRTGWIIAPEKVAVQCLKAKWQATVAAPYLSELITAAALTNAKDILVQRCKEIAQRNFPIVQEWLEANEDLLTWVPPDGGVLGFPKFDDSIATDSVTLAKRLVDEHGVLISPGEYFGQGEHFRITFMNPEGELNTGLRAIAEVIQEFV
jgi:aspartate/methionine/tyrosine aminotransferase